MPVTCSSNVTNMLHVVSYLFLCSVLLLCMLSVLPIVIGCNYSYCFFYLLLRVVAVCSCSVNSYST